MGCGSGNPGSIPRKANLPMTKGLKPTSSDLLVLVLGYAWHAIIKDPLATHDVGPGSSSNFEQAEMSLNVTLNHNTTKF